MIKLFEIRFIFWYSFCDVQMLKNWISLRYERYFQVKSMKHWGFELANSMNLIHFTTPISTIRVTNNNRNNNNNTDTYKNNCYYHYYYHYYDDHNYNNYYKNCDWNTTATVLQLHHTIHTNP